MATKHTPVHNQPVDDTDEHHGHISVGTYYRVFAALMLLMVATVGFYYLDKMLELPTIAAVGVAMLIACTKTALIVLYFMHVRVSSKVTQIFAVAAFVWLMLLFMITMGDYLARDWPVPSEGPLTMLPWVLS